MNKVKLFALVLATAIALTFGIQSASADITSYSIADNGGGSLTCCTGPYASLDVNRTSTTTAVLTFNSLTNGGYLYLLAGVDAAAVNVNATTWTLTGLTGTMSLPGFSSVQSDLSNGGAGVVNGFGSVNQTVNNFDGFTHSWTTISFTLTNTSGTWGTASAVLVANSDGTIAATHGFACATPCTVATGAFATGFARNGDTPQVPEPASLILLGSGLAGLGLWGRKRFKG